VTVCQNRLSSIHSSLQIRYDPGGVGPSTPALTVQPPSLAKNYLGELQVVGTWASLILDPDLTPNNSDTLPPSLWIHPVSTCLWRVFIVIRHSSTMNDEFCQILTTSTQHKHLLYNWFIITTPVRLWKLGLPKFHFFTWCKSEFVAWTVKAKARR